MPNPTNCPVCEAPLPDRRARYCRDECRWEAKEQRRRDSGFYERRNEREARKRASVGVFVRGSGPRVCAWPDCPERTDTATHCRTHAATLRKREARRTLDTSPSSTDARRRARYFGVTYESFRKLDVFTRDAWVCQLCMTQVDKSLRWPHPMSPSLDHVVPMSKGGPHIMSNAQLAHLRCNIAKGDRHEVVEDGELAATAG